MNRRDFLIGAGLVGVAAMLPAEVLAGDGPIDLASTSLLDADRRKRISLTATETLALYSMNAYRKTAAPVMQSFELLRESGGEALLQFYLGPAGAMHWRAPIDNPVIVPEGHSITLVGDSDICVAAPFFRFDSDRFTDRLQLLVLE